MSEAGAVGQRAAPQPDHDGSRSRRGEPTEASGTGRHAHPIDAGPDPSGGQSRGPRTVAGCLIGLVVLRGAVVAAFRPGWVLDDWTLVGRTSGLGVWHTLDGTTNARSRPGAWVVFNTVYGLADRHPLVLLALLTAAGAVVAVLLYLLLRHLLTERSAVAVTVVWVLLPNHQSLAAWGATIQVAVALILLLAGIHLLLRGRWLAPACLFALAGVTYELTIIAAALFVVAAPASPPLRWRPRLAILTVLAATALWLAAHPIYEVRPYVPNLGILWSAHFGTGLFGTPDVPGGLNEWAFGLSLPVVTWCGLTTGTGRPGPPSRSGRDRAALLNTAVAGVALLLTAVDFASAVLLAVGACVAGIIGTWRRRDWPALREGAGLVTVGVLMVVVGVAHVASGPLTVPGTHGVGDRLYAVSSIGGAVVLVGLGQVLWRWWRPAAVIAAAVALGAFVHGQLVVDAAYAAAARDARAVLAHLATQADHPEDHDVVLDRVDAHTGVAAFDDVSLRWAVVALHGPGRGSARVGTPEPDDGTTPEVPDLVVSWDDAVGSTP